MAQKVIVNASIYDEKMKQKAMKVVSELKGIQSIATDKNTGKMTVIGEIDPIAIVDKLNSCCNSWPCKKWPHASLESVGPKEEKKKEGEKKEKTPKEKEEDPNQTSCCNSKHNYLYFPPNQTQNYYVPSMEEDPNACVIS